MIGLALALMAGQPERHPGMAFYDCTAAEGRRLYFSTTGTAQRLADAAAAACEQHVDAAAEGMLEAYVRDRQGRVQPWPAWVDRTAKKREFVELIRESRRQELRAEFVRLQQVRTGR